MVSKIGVVSLTGLLLLASCYADSPQSTAVPVSSTVNNSPTTNQPAQVSNSTKTDSSSSSSSPTTTKPPSVATSHTNTPQVSGVTKAPSTAPNVTSGTTASTVKPVTSSPNNSSVTTKGQVTTKPSTTEGSKQPPAVSTVQPPSKSDSGSSLQTTKAVKPSTASPSTNTSDVKPTTPGSSSIPQTTQKAATNPSSKTSASTQKPDSTSAPTQKQGSTSAPTQKQGSTSAPTQKPNNTASPTLKPDSTSAPTQKPNNTVSPTQKQHSTSATTQKQGSTSVSTQKPNNTVSPTQIPDSTSAPTQKPNNTVSPTLKPDSTSAPTQKPNKTASPTQIPDSTSAPTQKPNNTASPTQKPDSTSVSTQTPANTSAPTQKPISTSVSTQKANSTSAPTQKANSTSAPTQKANSTSAQTQKPNSTAVSTQTPNSTAVSTQKPDVSTEKQNNTSSQMPTNTAAPTEQQSTQNPSSIQTSKSTTLPPRSEFVYINEIMLDKNGGFQKVELLLSKKLDVTKYTMVMVDGQTNKIMSTVSLKDMVIQKNGLLLVVTFNTSQTSPSMKDKGTGVAIYDTRRTSMKADWTVSETGLVDALVIGKSYTRVSEHLTDILTPGVNPFILDPNKYGMSKTISRCSSDLLRSTDMYALINPSFGVDNRQKCRQRLLTSSDFAMKIQHIDCDAIEDTNQTANRFQLTVKKLIHYIVKQVNTECQCGVTRMHIVDPTVHCCDGASVDMRFVAPNKDQLTELKDSYISFLKKTQHVNVANHLYAVNNSCYENCCNVAKHPKPKRQDADDTAKNVKVTVAVIVSCLIVFMIIVIVVIMYMRRKKSAVYQFRMSRLDEEDDLVVDGPDHDDFVGGQEATFDINSRYQ